MKLINILKNRTAIGIICIVLSLFICFGLTPLFNKAVTAKKEIVRVTEDIKEGELITNSNVKTVTVGGYNLPSNVAIDKSAVIGKYAIADLMKGDYILGTKVSSIPLSNNEYLCNFDGEQRAISITIDSFAAGLSAKLEKGDVISIIWANDDETDILEELRYVEVLAVTTPRGVDGYNPEQAEADRESKTPSTVTLLVNEEQAIALAKIEEEGHIHIALVYRGEKRVNELLKIQEEYFNSKIQITSDNSTGGKIKETKEEDNE